MNRTSTYGNSLQANMGQGVQMPLFNADNGSDGPVVKGTRSQPDDLNSRLNWLNGGIKLN